MKKKASALMALLSFPLMLGAQTEAGIVEESVDFGRGEAVYSGTLSKPAGEGPFPVVIMVSGMGPQDRDWSFGSQYKLARIFAAHLSKNGIAVYRYDDRGFGKSTGASESLTSFDELAEDVHAAVTRLRGRTDTGRVGLLGHSLGGILSIIAASRHRDIDFIITLSGSYQTGGDIMMEQARTLKRWKTSPDMTEEQVVATGEKFVNSWRSQANGGDGLETMKQILGDLIRYQLKQLPPEKLAENLKNYKDEEEMFKKNFDDLVAFYTSPHMKSFAVYDPVTDFKKISCPILVLFGQNDKHVAVKSNLPRIAQVLPEAAVTDLTIRIIPEVDHGYTTPELLKEGKIGPGVLEFITNWISFRNPAS